MTFEPPKSVQAALDAAEGAKAASLRRGIPWCDVHEQEMADTPEGFVCERCEEELATATPGTLRLPPPRPADTLFGVSDDPQTGDVKISMPGGEAPTRSSDPSTSHAAARSVGDLRASQRAVYEVLSGAGDLTDEELADVYPSVVPNLPQSPSGLRTRRSELHAAGLVIDSGERRPTDAGRMSIVWRIA